MDDVLPDVLAPGLRVVFSGNAAGKVSAAKKAPYAGPGNYFWPVLHKTGLTPVLLAPEEFRRLPEFGLGLTDACKTHFGSDAEVGTANHDPERVRRAVAAFAPQPSRLRRQTGGDDRARGRGRLRTPAATRRGRADVGPALDLRSRAPLLERGALA